MSDTATETGLAEATRRIAAVEADIAAENRRHEQEASRLDRIVVAAAIRDLADDAPELRRRYMGTKNYDRWHGQKEGGSYGSGPSHGTTIFSVGIRPEFRDTFERGPGGRGHLPPARGLTEAERDAAISYLHALLGTLARP